MRNVKTRNPVYSDNTVYFLTDSTYLHYPYFKTEEQKIIVLNQIKKINKELGIPISAYSISANHYHLKFYIEKSSDMAKIKKLLRGGISYEYRRKYKVEYDSIWQSRKIIYVNSENANWKITGYIIGNLLKHKEVSAFEELKANEFSSFRYMAEKYGDEEMRELVRGVIDIEEDAFGAIDLGGLDNLNFKNRAAKAA